MDEARAPTAAPRRTRRWRSPWLMPGVPAAVLAVLTINVLASGPLVAADQRIHVTVRTLASSHAWQWLHGPARLIVDLADPVVAVTVLVVSALAIGARRRSLRPLLTAGVAAALLLVTVIPAKILIGRLGPGRLRPLAPGALGSFPSGHTTTASVCYVLAVLPLLPYVRAWIRRAGLAALPVWCLLIGVALVWLNFHWFTDVVAGWALAAIIIQATLRLTRGAYSGLSTPPGVPDERIASPSTT
jgi:membrane-associated phospholipid phosphatase